MHFRLLSFACGILSVAVGTSAIAQRSVDSRVESLLRQLTLEEKVSLCHGGSSFATKAIPRLGIPSWNMSDGPHGRRGNNGEKATYFPTGVALASTWNPGLAKLEGVALGEECRFYRIGVLLGPAINIDRTPLGGRDFEYMSEDPFLAGRMAVGWVQGLQSQGVAACAKHFAANSQETERGTINASMSERTLREIYLPAFHDAVVDGGAMSVMAAYNKLQGTYCSENSHLLNDILKHEWGFRGVVMSDWGATHSTVGAANGGLDLEMPGGGPRDFFGDRLLEAVHSGQVSEATINDKVRRILRDTLLTATPKGKAEANTPAHQALARRIADQAIVLLKNARSLLPLDTARVKSIAVIGPAADTPQGAGGGSSTVYPPYEITPLQGIRKAVGDRVAIRYIEGVPYETTNATDVPSSAYERGVQGQYFDNPELRGEPKVTRTDRRIRFFWTGESPAVGLGRANYSVRWTGSIIAPQTGVYEIGTRSDDGSRLYLDGKLLVDSWGTHGSQQVTAQVRMAKGSKHAIRVEYFQARGEASVSLVWKLPQPGTEPGIAEAAKAAAGSDVALVIVGTNHEWDTEGRDKPNMGLMAGQAQLVEAVERANPRTVVILVNGSPVEMEPWASRAPAILEAWYAGMEAGDAIADVLFGKVNPSGKLPVTFPKRLSDSPAHANGNYPGKNGVLRYDEGILVGYRYFDTKRVAPEFPFGHGLSYTSFTISNVSSGGHGTDRYVTADVRNTGRRAGAETVQLYVHDVKSSVLRPERELKAFQKVYLEPGQKARIRLNLDRSSFAYFSEKARKWVVEPGAFELQLGVSSRDIRARKTIQVK